MNISLIGFGGLIVVMFALLGIVKLVELICESIFFNKKLSLKQRIERLDKEIKESEIELMEYGNELEASRPRAFLGENFGKDNSNFVDVDNYLERNKQLLESTTPAIYYKNPLKKRSRKTKKISRRKTKKKPIWNKGKKMSKKYRENISRGMKKLWRKRRR